MLNIKTSKITVFGPLSPQCYLSKNQNKPCLGAKNHHVKISHRLQNKNKLDAFKSVFSTDILQQQHQIP